MNTPNTIEQENAYDRALKDVTHAIERDATRTYEEGVLDTLAWVTGQEPEDPTLHDL